MIFHKHNWIKIRETYAPPTEANVKGIEDPDIKFYGLMQGLTTILWECTQCHKIRKEEMLGRST